MLAGNGADDMGVIPAVGRVLDAEIAVLEELAQAIGLEGRPVGDRVDELHGHPPLRDSVHRVPGTVPCGRDTGHARPPIRRSHRTPRALWLAPAGGATYPPNGTPPLPRMTSQHG